MTALPATAVAGRAAPTRAPRGNGFRTRMARRAPLLPALLFTIVLTQLPFLYTVYISFLSWDRDHPELGKKWAGFDNFRAVFSDSGLRSAVLVTIQLTAMVVIVSVLMGLGLALLLDRK